MRFLYVVGVPTLSTDFIDGLSAIPHIWPQTLNRRELMQSDAIIALPSWLNSDHLQRQVDLAIDYGKRIFYPKTAGDLTAVKEWAIAE